MHFFAREDGRKSFGAPGAHRAELELERLVEHVAVEEDEGVERLVLGGGGDVEVDSQVGEEGFDLGLAHPGGVLFVVEQDEAADPVQIDLLGLVGVALAAQDVADLLEQARRLVVHRGCPPS